LKKTTFDIRKSSFFYLSLQRAPLLISSSRFISYNKNKKVTEGFERGDYFFSETGAVPPSMGEKKKEKKRKY
jgi:hypothetical protein